MAYVVTFLWCYYSAEVLNLNMVIFINFSFMVHAFLCLVLEILLYPKVIKVVSYAFFKKFWNTLFYSALELILVELHIYYDTGIFLILLHVDVQLSQLHILNLFTTVIPPFLIYVAVFCGLLFFDSVGHVCCAPALLLMLTQGLEVWVVKFRIVLVTPGSLHFQIYFRNVDAFLCFCRNYSDVL